jgi:peptidoglycan/LPS O-acetylase OafA/YrhL
MTAARVEADIISDDVAPRHAALGTHRHLAVLDGLRGTAAYCVLLFHALGNLALFANGYLMVDLFFLLSGFVLAYSYEDRLLAGLSLRAFAVRRFCRLYPTIFFGAIVSTLVTVLSVKLRHETGMDVRAAGISSLLSFVPLPYLTAPSVTSAFPSNTVLWSLFFEIVVNAVYAGFLRRLTSPLLVAIVILSLATIAWGGLGGNLVGNIGMGVPRVAAGFFGGVLLFRWWRVRGIGGGPALGLFPASAIVMAVALVPSPIGGALFLPVYMLFGMVILAAAGTRVRAGQARLCTFLASLSYPLYILHRPIILSMWFVMRRLIGAGIAAQYAAALSAFVLATIVCLVMVHFYEDPLRGRLTAMMRSWF